MSSYKEEIDRTERLSQRAMQYTNRIIRELNRDSNININKLSEVYNAVRKAKENRHEIGETLTPDKFEIDMVKSLKKEWGYGFDEVPHDVDVYHDGTVYAVDNEYLHKISSSGEKLTSAYLKENRFLKFVKIIRNKIFVADYCGIIMNVDFDGNVKKKLDLKTFFSGKEQLIISWDVDNDGNIWVTAEDSGHSAKVIKINQNLEKLLIIENSDVVCDSSKIRFSGNYGYISWYERYENGKITKINKNGGKIAQIELDESDFDFEINSTGNVIVYCISNKFQKYNEYFTKLLERKYNSPSGYGGRSININLIGSDKSGNVYCSERFELRGYGWYNYLLLKINDTLEPAWQYLCGANLEAMKTFGEHVFVVFGYSRKEMSLHKITNMGEIKNIKITA